MLGRIWPDPAGELGALELGELLWEEFPPVKKSNSVSKANIQEQQSKHATSPT